MYRYLLSSTYTLSRSLASCDSLSPPPAFLPFYSFLLVYCPRSHF